jgi:lysophospholipase
MFTPKLLPLLGLAALVSSQGAPSKVACPSSPIIRSAGPAANQSLSPDETAYVAARARNVLPSAWKGFLSSVTQSLPANVQLPNYVSSILAPSNVTGSRFPTLAIGMSGGGYRAAHFAAGVLTALDARNTTKPSGINGVLQAATYASALSGGGWFWTSLAQADFPTIPELIFPTPPSSNSGPSPYGGFLAQVSLLGADLGYLDAIIQELQPKQNAGLPVTLVDAWSRALARHFVNGTTAQNIFSQGTHGANIMYSGIRNVYVSVTLLAADSSSWSTHLLLLALFFCELSGPLSKPMNNRSQSSLAIQSPPRKATTLRIQPS